MTDLDERLTRALQHAAEGAPHVGDLANACTDPAAQATPYDGGGGGRRPRGGCHPAGRDRHRWPTSGHQRPGRDDWRTESFRDLTLQVPADWGHHGGPDWCAGSGEPAVTRGEGFLTTVDCEPRLTYGVQFRDVSASAHPRPKGVPADAVLDVVGTGSTSAWIVAESEEQLEQIRASAHEIDGLDANGCPPTVDPDGDSAGARVSVCRYDSGELEQSELLSVEDSASAQAAVAEAPVDDGGYVTCPEYSRRQPVVTLRSSGFSASVLPSSRCILATRFLDGDGVRLVTEEVLYWALSPGWQGRDSALPIPDPRRTR